ncbi:MAG TPA: mRNA surveillance protein pelota, partial [Archaeoglobaceae archaeon]|nr:mRNA surveillance protein pelota [Archaeoglobaceae archaeon]
VLSFIKTLDFRYIVLAGPGFTKEDFQRFLKEKSPEIADKALSVDTSSIGTRGFIEVLKRGVLKRIAGEIRLAQEAEYMDMLLENISKGRESAYGIEDVKKAYEYGAIEILLVSDEFLRNERLKWDIDSFLRDVENSRGKVVIMSTEFEPGKRLHALGGIAAILRFNI